MMCQSIKSEMLESWGWKESHGVKVLQSLCNSNKLDSLPGMQDTESRGLRCKFSGVVGSGGFVFASCVYKPCEAAALILSHHWSAFSSVVSSFWWPAALQDLQFPIPPFSLGMLGVWSWGATESWAWALPRKWDILLVDSLAPLPLLSVALLFPTELPSSF